MNQILNHTGYPNFFITVVAQKEVTLGIYLNPCMIELSMRINNKIKTTHNHVYEADLIK